MEPGLFRSVLFSWEVVAVCIALMLLLPLVFYIASTRSRKRIGPPAFARPATTKKSAKPPAPPVDKEPAEDAARTERPRSRAVEPAEDDDIVR